MHMRGSRCSAAAFCMDGEGIQHLLVDDLNVTRYISYDAYATDPERQQYFGMIHKSSV